MRSTIRTTGLTVLACLCLSAIGCGAFDAMEDAQGKKAQAGADGEGKAKNGWEQTTTIDPNGLDESIVRCNVRGSIHFSKREECLHRGGRPESPKG